MWTPWPGGNAKTIRTKSNDGPAPWWQRLCRGPRCRQRGRTGHSRSSKTFRIDENNRVPFGGINAYAWYIIGASCTYGNTGTKPTWRVERRRSEWTGRVMEIGRSRITGVRSEFFWIYAVSRLIKRQWWRGKEETCTKKHSVQSSRTHGERSQKPIDILWQKRGHRLGRKAKELISS